MPERAALEGARSSYGCEEAGRAGGTLRAALVRMHIVLDPGHGGLTSAGKSSAAGARGANGTLEKDVTLQLARRLSRHLGGGVALTRTADQNLSLGQRADCARRHDARVFLSLHANSGAPGSRGAETWVHDRARGDSQALAACVQGSLATFGSPDRGVKRAELAVLTPERLGARTVACLIEVDFLTDPQAERRLGNPDALDRIAAAIARGVNAFLDRADGAARGAYGRRGQIAVALAAPVVPARVRAVWAQSVRREHHNIWHFLRTDWSEMTPAEQVRFTNAGWRPPPRLTPRTRAPDAGAGIDFLGMHREMIAHTNAMLTLAADPAYTRVRGWNPIPFTEAVPPADAVSAWAKTPARTFFYQQQVVYLYENDSWHRAKTIDEVGMELEAGIHNWMHMHWSDVGPASSDVSVTNDYLGSPFSSAVNDVFWMLHGWIDDRIAQWERVNGASANLSGTWMGRMPPRPTTLSMAAMSTQPSERLGPGRPDAEPTEPDDPVTHALWLEFQERLLAWTFPELTEAQFFDYFPGSRIPNDSDPLPPGQTDTAIA
jgi:N-acetylmuramoyl-L-alanine amidase